MLHKTFQYMIIPGYCERYFRRHHLHVTLKLTTQTSFRKFGLNIISLLVRQCRQNHGNNQNTITGY